MAAAERTGWIETTSYIAEKRTLWIAKVGGEILKVAEMEGEDPSGVKAYEAACAWAEEHAPDVAFNWKHWRGNADAEDKK
jgi:hypothetical protein